MSLEKFKELLDRERIHHIYTTYPGIKKRCYENGIETLYGLLSYDGNFSKDTNMNDKTRESMRNKADRAIVWLMNHEYNKHVNAYTLCFSSDIFDIYVSTYTAGYYKYPFKIKYVNKSRNQYVYLKHDEKTKRFDIDESYYEDYEVDISHRKNIEYEIYIPDYICYRFVLQFDTQYNSNGIYEMQCTNSILNQEQLNDVLLFPNDIANRKYIAYKFLKEMGLLASTDIKELIDKQDVTKKPEVEELYEIEDDFVEFEDEEILDIEDDPVDIYDNGDVDLMDI